MKPGLTEYIKFVGYPANYGNVKIMRWDQRYRKRDQIHPEPVPITRATTPSFWRGFRMMLPVLTTLTGFDGKTALRAHRATVPRAGA
jgi:hypothetical protein